jgi:hypothetical protein
VTPPPDAADTRASAVAFMVWLAMFLPWMLVFTIGGPAVVGKHIYKHMDVTQLNLADYGLSF